MEAGNPDGKVINRDLTTTQLEAVSADWIGAAHTPETNLTHRQQEILGVSNELIRELGTADEYVIGVAMHNFSIPAVLKLWIDQVVRAGKTFSYEGGTPTGLLRGKKATFIVSSGGVYEPGTPMEVMNFVEPYLRSIFRFVGVTETRFINASGTARLGFGTDRAVVLQPALASIHAHFQAA